MADKTQTNDKSMETLGKSIYNLYTGNGFSKVMKAQVDELVFHTFLQEELGKIGAKKYINDGNINYDAVDKNAIYSLSLAAGLTEGVIQSRIEKDFFTYGSNDTRDSESFLKEFIRGQLEQSKLNRNDSIKDGKIRFSVPGPVLKKKVERAFADVGTLVDYSFSRDLLVVNAVDVIELLGADTTANNKILISEMGKYLPDIKSKDTREKLDAELKESKSVKSTVQSVLKYLGKTAYEKTLDFAFTALLAKVMA